jgi:hypothetical protein
MPDDHDLMLGAEPIAAFLSSLFDGAEITPTDVYNWCSRGTLPHKKHGAKIVGSKSVICAYFYSTVPTKTTMAATRPAIDARVTQDRLPRDRRSI